jgi:uncharacterized protein (DUF2267 family)
MSMTGLSVFDEAVHVIDTWLHEITSRIGWDGRQKGCRVLRASLHAQRDRMPVTEAMKFHISAGEIENVCRTMPKKLRALSEEETPQ